jgi:stage V sporulation protein G
MKITEVKVFPVNEDRLKAYVSITFEDCFVVRDLKIIQGPGGLFVAMPSKKRKDGQFRDIAHPLNQETRALIEDKVFEAYEEQLKSMGQSLDNLQRQKAPSSSNED